MKPTIVGDHTLYNGQFLQMVRRSYRDRRGVLRAWEMVQRKTYGRIVAVVAITPQHEMVLVCQFRPPIGAYVLEVPAGLRDRRGESEKAMARRELLEETGYAVRRLELLGAGPFSAGLTSDEIALYLGTGARKVAQQRLDGSEDISVVLVPTKKLFTFLHARHRGMRVDIKIAGVIPYLEVRGLI